MIHDGTDPIHADTDRDGVADGAEVAQGSDPADATDAVRPNSRVSVWFNFGDHSGSHSEKYRLTVTPVADSGEGLQPRAFSWVNANYGECEAKTARLKPGWRFGPNLSQNAHEAAVTALAGGAALPDGFVSLMESSGGKGVVMIEGRATGSSLRLQGFIDGSQTPSFEGALDIKISSVEDMYRYVTLRGAVNDSGFSVQIARREPRYAAFASVVLMVERE